MHKVLDVNGTAYKVSESFLLMLEVLEEYIQMGSSLADYKRNID